MRGPYFWGGLVLFSILYFVITGYGVPTITLLWAAASGVLGMMLLQLSALGEDDAPRGVTGSVLAAASIVIGTSLKAAVGGSASAGWDSAAVATAAFSAWGFDAIRSARRTVSCFRCHMPVSAGASFVCPRCSQSVCARPTCWNNRHIRCTLCFEREVVLFPKRDDWWAAEFGPRVNRGSCDYCNKEAHEADLRSCGQCPSLMCRRCWDHFNGICNRCHWQIRSMPKSLWPYVQRRQRASAGPAKGRGRGTERRSRETRR